MKLKRFLLRYFPPGIILEYTQGDGPDATLRQKPVDLLDLTAETDIEVLVNQIVRQEPLISENRKPQLRKLCYKLIEKIDTSEMSQNFYLFKILRAHILPLTNCAFNKSGDRFITGSYDRTCKVWNTLTGEELLTLEGHKNVVYAIAFNNPFGDKVVTGSFDKTAKIWNSATGELLQTLRGHTTEIVCLSFDPHGQIVATVRLETRWKRSHGCVAFR
jgi:dynein assembly factor with WDR repeat domains 1